MVQGDAVPKRSFVYRQLKKYRFKLNELGARYSRIPNDPVLDAEQFDWASRIAEHWAEIRDEALAVYAHLDAVPPLRRISPDHRRIAEDDRGRGFFPYRLRQRRAREHGPCPAHGGTGEADS